jgi:enoyl-CoA hydratase/carnithine racemase
MALDTFRRTGPGGSVDFEDIRYEIVGSAAVVTINRPHRYNAFRAQTVEEMIHAFRSAWADKAVRVVVLTGAGDKAFCTGGDVKQRAETGDYGPTKSGLFEIDNFHRLIRDIPKPVIAAVNGPAVGIGCSLALACDLVLAGESAYFGLAFVNIGLMPDGGSTALVPAAVGKARAFQLALLGERVTSAQALEWGLVNFVYPDPELMAAADELVRRFASGPTRSYASSKVALNRFIYGDLAGQLALEADLQHQLGRTRDFLEGTAAFVEKRKPEFTGA